MQRTSPWVGGLLFLALLLPAFGSDDKPENTPTKPAPAKTKPEKKAAEKPRPFTYGLKLPAKLVRFEPAKHTLTVEITYKGRQNPDAVRHLAQLQRQLLTTRDPRSALNTNLEIAKNQQNLFKDETKKIDLETTDDLKVRTRLLPLETDDKGKPRRLSEQEKRELKGPDPKLPGYTAERDSLQPGQRIEIYLEKLPRNASRQLLKDLTDTTKKKPKAVLILIVAEPRK